MKSATVWMTEFEIFGPVVRPDQIRPVRSGILKLYEITTRKN